MKSRRWRRRHAHDVAELNITAFMNLMVILVPFLLITAVFSRLTILELSLPAPSDGSVATPNEEFNLEVVIREDVLEVADTKTGLLKSIPRTEDGPLNLSALSAYLQQVKANFPDKTAATILLEADIEYETLVQVMDTVRVFTPEGLTTVPAELFPDISIGDAVVEEDG